MTFTLPLFVIVALVWAFVAAMLNIWLLNNSPYEATECTVGVWAVYFISLIPTTLYAILSLGL